MTNVAELPPEKKRRLATLLGEREARKQKFKYKTVFEMLYEWQREFITLTATFSENCLCAANR